MTTNLQYAYLVGTLLGLPIWLLLYFHRKDLRIKILIASVIIGIAAVITEPYFLADYWRPDTFNGWAVGVEDFLYGFIFGGMASVVYEEIYGKRYSRRHDRTHHWAMLLLPFFILSVATFFFGKSIINLNTMYAALCSLAIATIFIIYYRRDLFVDSLMSGLLVGFLTLIGFVVLLKIFPSMVESWWMLDNLSRTFVLGIPSEELFWAFGLGTVAGPFYEFFMGLKFAKP